MAAPGVASRKTGGRLSKAGKQEKEKTLIKLLIHWAPRPQTHWPDCLAGCVCEHACVCVCVRSPHPQHAFASCDYLIVSHYPPPSTPLALPEHEALPRPPFQPTPDGTPLGWAGGCASC